MSLYKSSPFFVPSKWFLEICEPSDHAFDVKSSAPDYGTISFAMELSDDSDRVLSAITDMYYMINHYHDAQSIVEELMCGLIDDRWIELFIMDTTVMREVVKLIAFLNSAPLEVVREVKGLLISDKIAAETFVSIWFDKNWAITDGIISIVEHSEDAWKFIDRLVYDSSYASSHQVVRAIVKYKKTNPQMYRCAIKLLTKNESCLEYLLNLDNVNGYGIQSTIDTIVYYDLWKIVFRNGAARPIVDYVLVMPNIVQSKLEPGQTTRDWLMRSIEKNNILADYIALEDLANHRFTEKIFDNASTIEIILEWVDQEDSTEALLDGLVSLAARASPDSCKRIHDLIYIKQAQGAILTQKLSDDQWAGLMENDANHTFVETELKKLGKHKLWEDFVLDHKMVPYWVETDPQSDTWFLCNLNSFTVSKIGSELCRDILQHPHLITYDNWIVLFQTHKGVDIGIKCISYVIQTGALFALFQSSFLSKDQLVDLLNQTDTLDYCDEEDFVAVSRRSDAFEIDFELIKNTNQELNNDILTTWHDPDRLSRMANMANMSFRDYLSMV